LSGEVSAPTAQKQELISLSKTYTIVSFIRNQSDNLSKKMKRISSDTPLSPACRMIEQFGSRWALLVLLTLEQHGTLRYSALRRNIPGGISERMLAATLDGLEQSGLVDRTVYPEVPPRVEYRLTPKTASLLPILHELLAWTETHAE
jgi:DNA-binding HxlR family transcriptional regulator